MAQAEGALVGNLVSLVQVMRRAGLPVSSEQVIDLLRGLALINIGQREQVYHAARGILVSRYEHLRLFETLFNAFWRARVDSAAPKPQKTPRAPRHDAQTQPALVTYMARKAAANDPEIEAADRSGTYSDLELLQRKDFSQMTDEELEAVKRLMQAMRWKACFRRTRRKVAAYAARDGERGATRRRAAGAGVAGAQMEAAPDHSDCGHQRVDGEICAAGAAILLRHRAQPTRCGMFRFRHALDAHHGAT
jgi:uncharacterized protein